MILLPHNLRRRIMKKALLAVTLLTCTLSSAFAQSRHERRDPIRDLRECEIRNDILRRDVIRISDDLAMCRKMGSDRGRVDQLERENADLRSQNSFILNENSDLRNRNDLLKIDIARLEDELRRRDDRDGRRGDFDLAQSIMACSKINNAVYSQQCASLARTMSIRASVIEQCARINNTYYALECVKSAGSKNTNARQVEACLGIKNDVYAQQCVAVAGEKQIRPDVIQSCVLTSTNTYYQLECVKSM